MLFQGSLKKGCALVALLDLSHPEEALQSDLFSPATVATSPDGRPRRHQSEVRPRHGGVCGGWMEGASGLGHAAAECIAVLYDELEPASDKSLIELLHY